MSSSFSKNQTGLSVKSQEGQGIKGIVISHLPLLVHFNGISHLIAAIAQSTRQVFAKLHGSPSIVGVKCLLYFLDGILRGVGINAERYGAFEALLF